MGQARDEAGNIWETDAQGIAVRLVQPAGAGRVFTLPQNPEKAAAESRQAERDAATDADRAADNARADEALQLQRDNAARAAAKDAPAVLSPEDRAEVAAEAQQKIKLIDSLLERSKNGWFATGFGAGTAAMIPGSTARDVANDVQTVSASGALQRIMEMARNNGGKNPLTPLSNADFNALGQSIANLDPSQSDEQFQRNLQVYRSIYERALGAASPAEQRADNEVPGQVTGGANPPPNTPADPGDLPPANMPGGNDPTPPPNPLQTPSDPGAIGGAQGGTRTIDHPEIRSMVSSMVNAGAGLASINAALKEYGRPPISFGEFDAVQKWMKANPGKAYPAESVRATETVPLSLMQRAAGSAPGAFTAQMANAATAGLPVYLAGDQGRGAIEAMEAMHPDASTLGTITGGVTGMAGAELGLAARAPAALARYVPRAADVLFGATSGFTGAEDGNRLEGALTGAVVAPLAGKAGETVMRGAGAAMRGVTNPAVQYLRSLDIPMTAGQIMGGGAKKIEDALTSIPFVGNMVDARRREGFEGFNRAAFDVGAETTGGQVQDYGAAGINQLRDLVGDTYSRALDPVQIDANTPDFINGLAGTIQAAQRIPNVNGAQDAAMEGLRSRIEGAIDPTTDLMAGRGFQEAYRGLARTGRERASGDYGHEVGQVMRQGQDVLASTLEQQNPGAYAGFLDANAANRRMNILADAVGRGKNADDQLFTPAQLNMADDAAARRLTSKVHSAAGDRPFFELATAGQEVLPSKLPDSGTSTRALIGYGLANAGLGGAGYAAGEGEGAAAGTGIGLATTLALMAGGTRRGQMLARELLLNRPDVLRAAGEGLQRNARIAGWTGAGALTPLVVGP